MTGELITALSQATEMLGAVAVGGFVVFVRIGAAMALLPAFGEQIVPLRVRLAAAIAFTAIVAPAVAPGLPQIATPGALAQVLVTEALAGLVIGIAVRLFVIALQTAGTIAAQAMSLAQFFGGAGVDPQPAMSQILVVGGLALAVISGLHVRLAEYLILSYLLLPAGMWPGAGMLAEWGVARIAHAFGLAFRLAMPFVIAALIYNIALGAINKAMPQLMVAFVGAPAITFGGLALLMLVAPVALPLWLEVFETFMADPTEPPR